MTVTRDDPTGATAILLCSSDNTFDVGTQISAAFDRMWPDCPFPRFVLTTSTQRSWPVPGWAQIAAGEASGWRGELRRGLDLLPAAIRHVVLVLDDFLLLAPVDTARAVDLVGDAERRSLAYLRLKPIERSIAAGLVRTMTVAPGTAPLAADEPYYASLQLAVWRRDHLVAMLAQPGSIWDFEHQRIAGETHHAVTRAGPIRYLHVVEKGRWMPYAARAFRKAGVPFDPGTRPAWNGRYMVTHAVRKLRFALFGYAVMRLKGRMRRRGGRT